MSDPGRAAWSVLPAEEERFRPLYARVLGLRCVNPGGVLCFLYFEGAVALAALLALAELVSWWAVVLLPASVAVMVKLNDVVAACAIRWADGVPDEERERFRREVQPAVGRAQVRPVTSWPVGRSTTSRAGTGRLAIPPSTRPGRGGRRRHR